MITEKIMFFIATADFLSREVAVERMTVLMVCAINWPILKPDARRWLRRMRG